MASKMTIIDETTEGLQSEDAERIPTAKDLSGKPEGVQVKGPDGESVKRKRGRPKGSLSKPKQPGQEKKSAKPEGKGEPAAPKKRTGKITAKIIPKKMVPLLANGPALIVASGVKRKYDFQLLYPPELLQMNTENLQEWMKDIDVDVHPAAALLIGNLALVLVGVGVPLYERLTRPVPKEENAPARMANGVEHHAAPSAGGDSPEPSPIVGSGPGAAA